MLSKLQQLEDNRTLNPIDMYLFRKNNNTAAKSLIRGIWVKVMRSNDSKGKNIISNKYENVLLTGPDIPQRSELDRGAPIMIIKALFNKSIYAVPENLSLLNPKFSGNFIWLPHKSFPSQAPIPVWDEI